MGIWLDIIDWCWRIIYEANDITVFFGTRIGVGNGYTALTLLGLGGLLTYLGIAIIKWLTI